MLMILLPRSTGILLFTYLLLTGVVLDNGHCAISPVLSRLEILHVLKTAIFRSRAKLTRCSNAQESDVN